MKYLVITSKHHEGFSMFDSAISSYDILDATPYGEDVMKALSQEAKKQGIRLGFYSRRGESTRESRSTTWNRVRGCCVAT